MYVLFTIKIICAQFNLPTRPAASSAEMGLVLPWRWMPPEVLMGKPNTRSDVWSLGILVWEIFSFGAIPFQECNPSSIY